MNVRIMYEPAPIRHIAVQCPDCERWFNGRDISDSEIGFDHELLCAQFKCPVCGKIFGPDQYNNFADVVVEECGNHNEVYQGTYKKVEKWEMS